MPIIPFWKNLIQNDIIESIDKNLRAGNITLDDSRKLKRLTHRLYEHIYSHYEEMEDLNDMTDESLMLDIDIIEKQHEMELAEKDKIIAEKDIILNEHAKILNENAKEIALLKKQLEKIQTTKS